MFSACAWPASGIGCKLLLALRLCRACVKSVTFCKVVWLGVTVVSVAAMLGQIVVMFKACQAIFVKRAKSDPLIERLIYILCVHFMVRNFNTFS